MELRSLKFRFTQYTPHVPHSFTSYRSLGIQVSAWPGDPHLKTTRPPKLLLVVYTRPSLLMPMESYLKLRHVLVFYVLPVDHYIWHYRLWSFKSRDTELERFLPKNQHT